MDSLHVVKLTDADVVGLQIIVYVADRVELLEEGDQLNANLMHSLKRKVGLVHLLVKLQGMAESLHDLVRFIVLDPHSQQLREVLVLLLIK